MVANPAEYRWSSYGTKVGNENQEWLDLDPCYMGLAGTQKKRWERYEDWVKGTIPQGQLELIRQSLQRGQLTGSERFVDEIEEKIKRRVTFRGQGRPGKTLK
jgi:putative transposase